MKVTLRYNTPLWVCSEATRQCWDSRDKSDTELEYYIPHGGLVEKCREDVVTGEKDKALIERIGNQHKHKSVLEHLVYTFDIDGISRACLQEVARHRMASYSVKSTRYTLKELKELPDILVDGFFSDDVKLAEDFVVLTGDKDIDGVTIHNLGMLQKLIKMGKANDKTKYCLPEAYKTSLTITINARSLQNFLVLRTSPSALWEIGDLAMAMYEALPEEHKYLFKDSLYDT